MSRPNGKDEDFPPALPGGNADFLLPARSVAPVTTETAPGPMLTEETDTGPTAVIGGQAVAPDSTPSEARAVAPSPPPADAVDSTGDHLRAADFVSLAQGAGAGETASSRAEEELDGWDEGSADPSELAEAGLASETLARLYEEQGHVDAAVAIRRGLVVPDDWTVVVLGESGLDWEGVKIKPTREGILCRWTVGPARLAGGKAVHDDAPPSDLQLVLRLASTNLDGTRYWDLEPVRESGFCVLKPEGARDATHVIAAVGLKSPSGRFLPLVHTRPLPLPDSVRRSGR